MSRKTLHVERIVLLLLFAAAAAIAAPYGDIPINDDFNFAHATWSFAETGQIEFTRLTGMSLRLQVLWGALWTWAFGRSFEVLRMSSVVLAALTILVVHGFLVDLELPRPGRVAWTLVFAAHPIFFSASFNYMTHVPFVFLSVCSVYATWRYAREGSRRWAVAAVSLVIGSCFIRQTGIANAAPLAVMFLFSTVRSRPERFMFAALPVATFVVLFFFTPFLQGYPGQISEHYALWKSPNLLRNLLYGGPLHWAVYAFQYGVFFTPAAAIAFVTIRPRSSRSWLVWLLVAFPFLAIATHLSTVGFVMPYRFGGNVIANFAFGPLTLRDTFCFDREYVFSLSMGWRTLLTYATALAGAHALYVVGSRLLLLRKDMSDRTLAAALLAAHAAAGVFMLFPSGIFFDRYALDCLWSLALIAAILVGQLPLASVVVTFAALLQLAFCAIGLSEYMSWQRARWRAWEFASSRGVTLRQIDAGYEVNHYLLGGVHGKWKLALCGMSVVDDEYILTFRPMRGWRPLASFPYRSFAGLRSGQVVLSRRAGQSPFHRLPPKKELWDQ